ncbi:MAG: hypothetical protein AB1421_09110 [Pseudomonadota bacterium]
MNKLGILAAAAQFAPRLFQVRRGTWFALAVGLVVFFVMAAWTVVALLGWFLGQARDWMGTAGGVVPDSAQQVLEQVAPGVGEPLRDQLGVLVPVLKAEDRPPRDVSGTDLGPVARYPGLVRTHWHREGRQVVVEYEGKADYAAVLDHYTRGFSSRGFSQSVQSANQDAERHAYTRAGEDFLLTIAQKPRSRISVHLETTLR